MLSRATVPLPLLLLALLISCAAPLGAAPRQTAASVSSPGISSNPVDSRRGELKGLQKRLDKLNREAARTEATRASAHEQLKATESAIAEANRHLTALGQQRGIAETTLDDLQRQSQRLERQVAAQQAQLGQLLYRQYANGDIDALRLLLSGGNANQAARDLYYMTLLSRAKADLLGVLRQSLGEKQRLSEAMQSKREELATIEKDQEQQRVILLEQQQQRQAMLDRLGNKLKAQRDEIDRLRRDEKQLGKLIDELMRIAARQSKARAAARKQAATRAAPLKVTPTLAAPKLSPPKEASGRNEPGKPDEPIERNEQEPRDFGDTGRFAALKGRLYLPVRGDIQHRFGTPRAEGALWKGIFIRTPEGVEVKNPAPGRVVFADWLRGFGHLLIIDHGDGWLTVHGNNQTLRRHVGDIVKTGETIASTGSSGGNLETGLYFELRQQGRVIDPLKWFSLK